MSNKIDQNLRPLALYFHWPFCLAKCPYCDFNSHVAAQVDHERWRTAFVKEIEFYHKHFPDRYISSIFFGGGTPSLMEAQTVQNITECVDRLWGIQAGTEITLEANPTSIEASKFKDFRTAGINRVSVGLQSLIDEDLKKLGREHSAKDGLKAIALADQIFDRFSFDLIYTRQDQTLESWESELQQALKYAGDHLSLYQLTIEPGTQYKTLFDSGRLILPDDKISADFYTRTLEIMDDAGLPAYEISNYAKPGEESRHNLTYWKYRDYAGIGPGAHGRLSLNDGRFIATRAHRAPDIWLNNIIDNGASFQGVDTLTQQTRFDEMVMMGLRLREGLCFDAVEKETGLSPQACFNPQVIEALAQEKYVTETKKGITLTEKGMPVLNAITAAILA